MTTQDDDDDDNSRSTVDSGLLPCPNKGQGCLVELLLEDLVKHMAECPYRVSHCLLGVGPSRLLHELSGIELNHK